jgi:glycine/sarcosine N-methyltransferase
VKYFTCENWKVSRFKFRDYVSPYIRKAKKVSVKIRQVGNSAVVSIPSALKTRGFQPGQMVDVEEQSDGSIVLTPTGKREAGVQLIGRRVGKRAISDASKSSRLDDGYVQYTPGIATYWDSLIDWDKRQQGEGAFFVDVLRQRNAKKVLDVACGTGYDSIRLLQEGFRVRSCDGSLFMLTKARINAEKRGLRIDARFVDWRRIRRAYRERFDAIVFLGNSFCHLFDGDERLEVLEQLYNLLEPKGTLIIDQRNFDKILDDGFSTSHSYVYVGEHWNVEPLECSASHVRFLYSNEQMRFELDFYPIRFAEMTELLAKAGFRTESYGDYRKDFNLTDADFIQHICSK